MDTFIIAAWHKATPIPNQDSDRVRLDPCGTPIAFDDYGKGYGYGWDVGPLSPRSINDFATVRPIHWRNLQKLRQAAHSWG
ncbi:MAG: hypothetical protein KF784_11615 [Fimbriimonadaceae bacterium]|nr:hypothetical protein [Fimbriimonadaceae bacterium]